MSRPAVEPIAAETERILGDLSEAHKGILVAIPVSRVWGLRH